MAKNKKLCASFLCCNPTRTKDHDFCSYCWFKTPAILKRRYHFAKYQQPKLLDRAITDIIRALERKKDASNTH